MPPGAIKKSESNFSHDHLQIKWTAPTNTFVTKYEVTINGSAQETGNNSPLINFNKELIPGKYYAVSIVTISGTTNKKRSSPLQDEIRTTPTSKQLKLVFLNMSSCIAIKIRML